MDKQDRGTQGASLLLLEDDWDHRNVFRDFLEHRGWTVLEATQASSARTLVAAQHIDVIVMDLGGTNGWALLEELGARADRPRLLCLTGDARPESRARAAALGADRFLVKPIPLRLLAEEVEALAGHAPRAADRGTPPSGAAGGRSGGAAPAGPSAAEPTAQAGPADPGLDGPDRHHRPIVLLLEDDEDARAIYRDMLDFAGYEVVAACDGIEGLRYAETRTPDVVVTDLHMPGMNGVEVARTLREESATAPTIIAVTADSLGIDAGRPTGGERPLFDEVLVKPVTPGELVRTVRAYVPPTDVTAH